MADKNLTGKENVLKLRGVRICFTDALYEAKGFQGSEQNKKFQSTFLVPKDSELATVVKNDIVRVAKAAWGAKEDVGKILAKLKAENRICFTDGDLKDYNGFEGHYALKASNNTRPRLLTADKKEITGNSGAIYAGCYVVAHIGLWAQDNQWGRRINANLLGVQFYADGEAFSGGGVSSVDEFDEIPQQSNTLSPESAEAFL